MRIPGGKVNYDTPSTYPDIIRGEWACDSKLFSWFVVYVAMDFNRDAYTAVRFAPGQQEVTLKPTSALLRKTYSGCLVWNGFSSSLDNTEQRI